MNNQIGVRLPFDQGAGSVPDIPGWKNRHNTFVGAQADNIAAGAVKLTVVDFQLNLAQNEVIDFTHVSASILGDGQGDTIYSVYLALVDNGGTDREFWSTPIFTSITFPAGINTAIAQEFIIRSLRFDDYMDLISTGLLAGAKLELRVTWKNPGAVASTLTAKLSVAFNKHQIGR